MLVQKGQKPDFFLKKRTKTTSGLSGNCAFYNPLYENKEVQPLGKWKNVSHPRLHLQRLRPLWKPAVSWNVTNFVSNFPGWLVLSQSNVSEDGGPKGPLLSLSRPLRKHKQESRTRSAAQTWNWRTAGCIQEAYCKDLPACYSMNTALESTETSEKEEGLGVKKICR